MTQGHRRNYTTLTDVTMVTRETADGFLYLPDTSVVLNYRRSIAISPSNLIQTTRKADGLVVGTPATSISMDPQEASVFPPTLGVKPWADFGASLDRRQTDASTNMVCMAIW